MTDMAAMKVLFGCFLSSKMGREKIEELCCLYALGELSEEESFRWDEHVRECESCRALTAEYKRIMLFDLPAITATQEHDNIADLPSNIDEDRLLANIHDRADAVRCRPLVRLPKAAPALATFRVKRPPRVRAISAVAGWSVATAAILLLAIFERTPRQRRPEHEYVAVPQPASPATQISALQARMDAAEGRVTELREQMLHAQAEAKESESAYVRSMAHSQDLAAQNQTLEAQLKDEQAKLDQASAALELTRQRLKDEIAAGDTLRGDLTDVSDRLNREKGEIVRLQRVAASTTTHLPVPVQPIGESEAKEMLGARDLHIVDVYDVDSSGKSSRAYGRIYFVNRNELIFYAFDLSKLESGHKVVAFQAWGFRQPQSAAVESLGLFYLDNATLNRWTLRISDPQVISRIDSLFVTVEPPGGSPVPKGRRLLMASLAGPPNHP